jgi:HSP20 family molecular chaperone IbpA
MSKETAQKIERELPRFRPATDIVELEDGFHILVDMPGVRKEELVIDLHENELLVSGKTWYAADPSTEPNKAGRRYGHQEFGGGAYQRTFTLSDTVDREKIAAKLENGVLNLFLPKAERAKPKRIEVTAG